MIVLTVTVASVASSTSNIVLLGESKWESLTQPHIWTAAISQALLTCHIGGGYLIAVSDSIYTTTNVQWYVRDNFTAKYIYFASNLISGMFSILTLVFFFQDSCVIGWHEFDDKLAECYFLVQHHWR